LNINSEGIEDYEVAEVQEESGYTCLHVTIVTYSDQVKYRVCYDDNQPDLAAIKADLKAGLERAKQTEDDIYLNEYPERSYLSVTYPDGTVKKYTATKIEY